MEETVNVIKDKENNNSEKRKIRERQKDVERTIKAGDV